MNHTYTLECLLRAGRLLDDAAASVRRMQFNPRQADSVGQYIEIDSEEAINLGSMLDRDLHDCIRIAARQARSPIPVRDLAISQSTEHGFFFAGYQDHPSTADCLLYCLEDARLYLDSEYMTAWCNDAISPEAGWHPKRTYRDAHWILSCGDKHLRMGTYGLLFDDASNLEYILRAANSEDPKLPWIHGARVDDALDAVLPPYFKAVRGGMNPNTAFDLLIREVASC